MGELEEFAEALLDQLSVEINEEKEIAELSDKIKEDPSSVNFDKVEDITQKIFPQMAKKVNEFIGIPISSSLKLQFLELGEFKKMKGKKSFFK